MRESPPTGGPAAPSSASDELCKLKRSVERSKEILNYVNRAVKEAEDAARLQDLQRRLDKTAFDKTENPISMEFRVGTQIGYAMLQDF